MTTQQKTHSRNPRAHEPGRWWSTLGRRQSWVLQLLGAILIPRTGAFYAPRENRKYESRS